MLQRFNITLEQRLVNSYDHIIGHGRINSDKNIHFAAADMRLNGGLNGLLRKNKAPRKSYRRIKELVVDAFQLNTYLNALNSALGTAVAGHAFYHFPSVSAKLSYNKFDWVFSFAYPLINDDYSRCKAESRKAAQNAQSFAEMIGCRYCIADEKHDKRNNIQQKCCTEDP